MALIVDPDRNEIHALERVTDWHGKRVIEIGCGNGRLTLRLARLGAIVHAIDPNADLIREAGEKLPRRLAQHISYNVGSAEHLDSIDGSFEMGVFAWSL